MSVSREPRDHTEPNDGSFELYYHDGWAHLRACAPSPGRRPVYREDVTSRMKLLGIPRAEIEVLTEIIEEADGEPHRLVPWPNGRKLASVITATVSEDKLEADVLVTEPKRGALDPTADEVVRALESAGVTHGVDRDEIVGLLANRRYSQPVVVAHGTPPVDAQPAKIRYHFNPHRGKPYLEMEYGRINLRELNFIENKAAGSLLAEVIDGVAPVNGRTVTGDLIVAKTDTEPVALVAGENTELVDDGRAIHATADGNVRLAGDAIIVEPVVVVEEVNYETGNIRFDGSVIVQRSIADGFVVEAGGDLQVERGIGRATIIAGGNVLLKSGINGGGEGSVTCGGNLVARYVEGAEIRCGENVFVEEAIMHSTISAVKHCVLAGRRAEVISSRLVVGGSLWCKKLGSISEAQTSVWVGIPPHVLASYHKARKELAELTDTHDKIAEQAKQIERAMAEGKEDPRLADALDLLLTQKPLVDTSIADVRTTLRRLRDRLEASKNSMVVVEDIIFGGSVVSFGREEFRPPTQGSRKTILKFRHGEIIESGFNPANRPELDFEDPEFEPDAGVPPGLQDEPQV